MLGLAHPARGASQVRRRRLRSSADTRDLADASGRCLHLADVGYTVDTGARIGPPKVSG